MWLAQLVGHATLDLRVLSLNATLDIDYFNIKSFKKMKNKMELLSFLKNTHCYDFDTQSLFALLKI